MRWNGFCMLLCITLLISLDHFKKMFRVRVHTEWHLHHYQLSSNALTPRTGKLHSQGRRKQATVEALPASQSSVESYQNQPLHPAPNINVIQCICFRYVEMVLSGQIPLFKAVRSHRLSASMSGSAKPLANMFTTHWLRDAASKQWNQRSIRFHCPLWLSQCVFVFVCVTAREIVRVRVRMLVYDARVCVPPYCLQIQELIWLIIARFSPKHTALNQPGPVARSLQQSTSPMLEHQPRRWPQWPCWNWSPWRHPHKSRGMQDYLGWKLQ